MTESASAAAAAASQEGGGEEEGGEGETASEATEPNIFLNKKEYTLQSLKDECIARGLYAGTSKTTRKELAECLWRDELRRRRVDDGEKVDKDEVGSDADVEEEGVVDTEGAGEPVGGVVGIDDQGVRVQYPKDHDPTSYGVLDQDTYDQWVANYKHAATWDAKKNGTSTWTAPHVEVALELYNKYKPIVGPDGVNSPWSKMAIEYNAHADALGKFGDDYSKEDDGLIQLWNYRNGASLYRKIVVDFPQSWKAQGVR